jgi:hypothetical protein
MIGGNSVHRPRSRRAIPTAPFQADADCASEAVKSRYSTPSAGSRNQAGSRNALMVPTAPPPAMSRTYISPSAATLSTGTVQPCSHGTPSTIASRARVSNRRCWKETAPSPRSPAAVKYSVT